VAYASSLFLLKNSDVARICGPSNRIIFVIIINFDMPIFRAFRAGFSGIFGGQFEILKNANPTIRAF